jgi:hypothetical protein
LAIILEASTFVDLFQVNDIEFVIRHLNRQNSDLSMNNKSLCNQIMKGNMGNKLC